MREQLSGLGLKTLVATAHGCVPAICTTRLKGSRPPCGDSRAGADAGRGDCRGDRDLSNLIERVAPDLLAQHGVGPEIAGQLLITAGDNPTRLRSEASFAALCGASPLPARQARPTDIASTAAATEQPTAPCTES